MMIKKTMKAMDILKLSSLIIFTGIILTSCKDDDPVVVGPEGYEGGKGFYIVNEGSFDGGNGSVSFYSDKQDKVYHDLYKGANGNSLGDSPLDMIVFGDTAAICVNGSGIIEFVNIKDFESLGYITGIPSPRRMVEYGSYLLVSDISTDRIFKINKSTFEGEGEIITGKAIEHMVVQGDILYAACWSDYYVHKPNNTILKIDLGQGIVVDSLVVTKEPNTMLADNNGDIWVLCSGGFLNLETPALYKISTSSFNIANQFDFVQGQDYPMKLTSSGESLYYLNNGSVYKMPITGGGLPSAAWFSGGNYLYSISADPDGDRVVVCDAKDFQESGEVFILAGNANVNHSFETGLAPVAVCFSNP